jgi:hypothetical protein
MSNWFGSLLQIIYYPWYVLRKCDSCGREFYRVRETSLYDEWKSFLKREKIPEIYENYACSMGCALSLFQKHKSSKNELSKQ